jgi:hypothetical protein
MDIPTAEAIIPVAIHEQDDYLCDVKQVVLHDVMKAARNAYNDAIRAHCRHCYKPFTPAVLRDLTTHEERCHAWAWHLVSGVDSPLPESLLTLIAKRFAAALAASPPIPSTGFPRPPRFDFLRFFPFPQGHIEIRKLPGPPRRYILTCPILRSSWCTLDMASTAVGDRAFSLPPEDLPLTLALGWNAPPDAPHCRILAELAEDRRLIHSAQMEAQADGLRLRLRYRRALHVTGAEAPV